MAKITILGCGFGTALAIMWDKYGHNVTAWSKYQEEIDAIMNDGEHKRLLPGVIVPPTIRLTTDMNCVSDCDILVFAIPSKFVREVAQKVKSYVKKDTIVVNVGKGFEENTDKRLSQVLGGTSRQPHSSAYWSFTRRRNRQKRSYDYSCFF